MPNRMERFSQRARRVLSLAQEEAERLGSQTIDTDHMLLGLMREEGGLAARVLIGLGSQLVQVQALVEDRSGEEQERVGRVAADLSADTKKSLELAVDEARRLTHDYIRTEHLLLGLLRLPNSRAANILRQLDIDAEGIRRHIMQALQQQVETAPPVRSLPSRRCPSMTNVEYLLVRIANRRGRINHYTIDMSPRVKNALEKAVTLFHTDDLLLQERHILLALLQNPDSALSRALLEMEIEREELIRRLSKPLDN